MKRALVLALGALASCLVASPPRMPALAAGLPASTMSTRTLRVQPSRLQSALSRSTRPS